MESLSGHLLHVACASSAMSSELGAWRQPIGDEQLSCDIMLRCDWSKCMLLRKKLNK